MRDEAVRDEVRRLDPVESQRGPQDDSSQARSADGRPENRGVRIVGGPVGSEFEDAPVGDEQLHRLHVVAEAAGTVVVLAVDVARDRSADRYLTRAGKYRDPETVCTGSTPPLRRSRSMPASRW